MFNDVYCEHYSKASISRMLEYLRFAYLKSPMDRLRTHSMKHYRQKKPGYTDNWIFLPAAGWRRNDDLDDVGFYGYYWSSSLGTYQVYGIYFEWAVINGFFGFRYSGNSVRPVSE